MNTKKTKGIWKNGGLKVSRTAICSVCGELLVDSYGDEFTNTKIIDLHGREFVIIIYKDCLEELLRKCANGGISNDNN
ncbi:Uncharacterised protein [Clostridioides difficile]|nr:Uncharacterised protein [Clostridioides difficile]